MPSTQAFRTQPNILPGDQPAEYDEILAGLTTHFSTKDLCESRWVREMAYAEWQLRRIRQMIAALVAAHTTGDTPLAQAQAYAAVQSNPIFNLESKYQQQYDRAYQGWSRRQNQDRRASKSELRQHISQILNRAQR